MSNKLTRYQKLQLKPIISGNLIIIKHHSVLNLTKKPDKFRRFANQPKNNFSV